MDKKRGYGSGSEVLDRAFFLFRVSHSSMFSCFRPGPVFLPRCCRCILCLFFILCSRCLLSWLWDVNYPKIQRSTSVRVAG